MRVPSGGGDGEDETSEETMMATGVVEGAHGIDRQTAEHRGTQGRGARTSRVSVFY